MGLLRKFLKKRYKIPGKTPCKLMALSRSMINRSCSPASVMECNRNFCAKNFCPVKSCDGLVKPKRLEIEFGWYTLVGILLKTYEKTVQEPKKSSLKNNECSREDDYPVTLSDLSYFINWQKVLCQVTTDFVKSRAGFVILCLSVSKRPAWVDCQGSSTFRLVVRAREAPDVQCRILRWAYWRCWQ